MAKRNPKKLKTMLAKVLPQAAPPVTRKLDLACGQVPKAGFEGVDLWPGATHVVDLQRFPWPFEDNSIEEIYCSHYIEHIPQYPLVAKPDGTTQNPFFAFFDEVHRILQPGGWIEVVTPNARNNRAFQDPTHQRFIVAETFMYLNAEWRKLNKLDHYNVACNFGFTVNFTIDAEVNLKHDAAKNQAINREWNVIHDWVVRLQKL